MNLSSKIIFFPKNSRILSHLKNRGDTRNVIILIMLLCILASTLWLQFAKNDHSVASLEGAISIGGVLATILGFSVVLVQASPSPIRVKVLLRSGSPFNDDIYRGLYERLGDHEDILLTKPEILEDTLDDQHNYMVNIFNKLLNDAQIDVIIIRPIYDSADVRELIQKGSRYGILIICLDTIVDPQEASGYLAEEPFYINVDNISGGMQLADYILSKNKPSNEKIHVLVFLGPKKSKPGTLRSLWFTWRLLSSDTPLKSESISHVILESWDRSKVAGLLDAQMEGVIDEMKSKATNHLYIFCGADAICISVNGYVENNISNWKTVIPDFRVDLLGFDGLKVRGKTDKYLLENHGNCKATIDVAPKDVGIGAGNIVLGKLKRYKRQQPNIITIKCTLKEFNS